MVPNSEWTPVLMEAFARAGAFLCFCGLVALYVAPLLRRSK